MSVIGPKRTCHADALVSAFGAKRTSLFATHMSAYDPKRTFGGPTASAII